VSSLSLGIANVKFQIPDSDPKFAIWDMSFAIPKGTG
jgi:hypothetical protein